MTEPAILELKKELKAAAQTCRKLQCDLIGFKRTGRGFRLNIFLLAFRPGFCGDPTQGVTQAEWNDVTESIRAALKPLDPDAPLYVEPWTAAAKFQARFETYILRTL